MIYKDPRIEKMAKNLVEHSVKVQPNENVLIEGPIEAKSLIAALIKEVSKKQANAFVKLEDYQLNRLLLETQSEAALALEQEWQFKEYDDIDCNIFIDYTPNNMELSKIPVETLKTRRKYRKKVVDKIVNTKKWVIVDWPNPASAQMSNMSFEEFADFLLEVSSMDYKKLYEEMLPIKELMDRTEKVRIEATETDLTFSIKGLKSVICSGERNVPDGEIYTAPVKDSVNGVIKYNTMTLYNGKVFSGVKLWFENGKIIKCTCDTGSQAELEEIFDTDEGARYVGEFALGVNPHIKNAFCNILFDEKINGSLHFTPGQAYEGEADNGNKSAVHWDLIQIQTPEYGGGKIWFDDVLVRKDGKFVTEDLKDLDEL